jgi:hypothetical protein
MDRLYLKPMLCKAIQEYCELNGIEDINNFANRCATQGFNIVKYGLSPADNIKRENNGIKDLKNESRKKRKEQPGVSGEEKQREKEEDVSAVLQGKEESSEENKPKLDTGVTKPVTVRKIRVIKKN